MTRSASAVPLEKSRVEHEKKDENGQYPNARELAPPLPPGLHTDSRREPEHPERNPAGQDNNVDDMHRSAVLAVGALMLSPPARDKAQGTV
jgi:hypothetical protein